VLGVWDVGLGKGIMGKVGVMGDLHVPLGKERMGRVGRVGCMGDVHASDIWTM